MSERRPPQPQETWNKLSSDGKHLSIYLAIGGQWSQDREFLEAMAKGSEPPFNVNVGLQDLNINGVLRTLTLIQEKREVFAAMPKPDPLILTPLSEVPLERLSERLRMLNPHEQEYMRIKHDIEEYETKKDENPERYKEWEKPRYKLTPEFQQFISTQFGPDEEIDIK
jgi:hypothetical protein